MCADPEGCAERDRPDPTACERRRQRSAPAASSGCACRGVGGRRSAPASPAARGRDQDRSRRWQRAPPPRRTSTVVGTGPASAARAGGADAVARWAGSSTAPNSVGAVELAMTLQSRSRPKMKATRAMASAGAGPDDRTDAKGWEVTGGEPRPASRRMRQLSRARPRHRLQTGVPPAPAPDGAFGFG